MQQDLREIVFWVALQCKQRQIVERRERDYEIGHSQGSFCMTRCKNTSDVFVAPVFTGCNERDVGIGSPFPPRPRTHVHLLCTPCIRNRSSLVSVLPGSSYTLARSVLLLLAARSRSTMSGIRKKQLAGTLVQTWPTYLRICTLCLFEINDTIVSSWQTPRKNDRVSGAVLKRAGLRRS